MAAGTRIGGSVASGLANLMLFSMISALWPAVGYCDCWPGGQGSIEMLTIDTWRPFIDNPGTQGSLDDDPDPRCPEPAGHDLLNLVDAPLPEGFDPHGYKGKALYACVRVGSEGQVVDAYLTQGSGGAAMDRKLVAEIRRGWSFKADPQYPPLPRWQRVRLTSGPVTGSVHQPMDMF
jgi:hypothetical protein